VSASRANVAFIVPVAAGLAMFAAIVLPSDGLSGERFIAAAAAFIAIAPGGAWILTRILAKRD
jgi:hypothetical protein